MSLLGRADRAAEKPESARSTASVMPAQRRDLGPWWALLGYVILTVISMWPALSDISNTVMGSVQPGDATQSGTWLGWQLLVTPPFATHTPYIMAPQGGPLWDGSYVMRLGTVMPQWLFAHMVGAIGSYNLATALGFVADGMAMYGLTRWLASRNWIAFVAGVLYAFSPFHVEESYAHIGDVYSWIFPLVVWAGLLVLQRPTLLRGLLLGVAVGAAGYVDGYYLLFAPLLATVLAGAGFLWAKRLNVSRLEVLKSFVAGGMLALLADIPIAIANLGSSTLLTPLLDARDVTGVTLFSARLWEYFVPWANSPLWGRFVGGQVLRLLKPVPPVETSLYLGSVVVLLTLALVTAPAIPKLRTTGLDVAVTSKQALVSDTEFQLPMAFLRWALPSIALVLIVCSLAWIGRLPGLPVILFQVRPFWRVFTRLDVAVDAVVILAAALTLAVLAHSRVRWLAPALALAAIIDGTAILPWSTWSFAANTPAAYQWLASHPDRGIVVDYPLPPAGTTEWGEGLTLQLMNHHPLFGGGLQGTPRGDLEFGIGDINDPQTIPTLRHYGVRYIILDKRYYISIEWRKVHLKRVRLLVDKHGVLLYRILPGSDPPAAITQLAGFARVWPYLPHVARYLFATTGQLGIERFQPAPRLKIRFHASSWKITRTLWVRQAGRVLWRGRVGHRDVTVVFETSSNAPLNLSTSPGVLRYPHAPHRTIDVTAFLVTRAP